MTPPYPWTSQDNSAAKLILQYQFLRLDTAGSGLMRAEDAGFTGKIAPARNYAVYVIPAEGDNLSTTEETIPFA
jgi:hypothetical protein